MSQTTTGITPVRKRHELKPRRLRVLKVRELTLRMRRITFVSDDLADFVSLAAWDHVKLVFPAGPGQEAPHPVFEDGRWNRTGDEVVRDYSVASYTRETITVDFVLHEHGIAGLWAQQAQPGQELSMLGPRGSLILPDEFAWYVMCVDEAAFPAATRWLGELRAGVPVTLISLIHDDLDVQELESAANLQVQWIKRADPESVTDPDHDAKVLTEAVRQAIEEHSPAGYGFAWAAGEAGQLRIIRRMLRTESGLNADQWDVDGYWRRGVSNFDHHEPIED